MTLQEIKDEVSRERLGKDWDIAKCICTSMVMMDILEEAAKRYAQSELSEANKEIERLKAVEAYIGLQSLYQQQEIERLKEGLDRCRNYIYADLVEYIHNVQAVDYMEALKCADDSDIIKSIDSLITPK